MRELGINSGRAGNRLLTVLLLFMAFISLPTDLSAGQFSIVWSTIDGGGGRSSGGQYVLTGTIGQPDAAYSSSGNYQVLGGFWPGGPLCFVDADDLMRFVNVWLDEGSGLPGDLDLDSDVDSVDFGLFANLWLCNCPYGWPLK